MTENGNGNGNGNGDTPKMEVDQYFEHLPKRQKTEIATRRAALDVARGEWAKAMSEAKTIANSKVFGQRTPEEVMGIALVGKDLGLSMASAMQSIHIVKGRPTLSAQLMRGLVQKSGKGTLDIEWNADQTSCKVTGHRPGVKDFTFSFGAKEAKIAGYTNKDNYRNHPRQMYLARASSVVCRAMFADVVMCLMSTEEMGYTEAGIIEVEAQPEPTPMGEGRQSFGKKKPAPEVETVEAKVEAPPEKPKAEEPPPVETAPEPVVEPEPEVDPDADEIAAIRKEWINDDSDDPGDEGARRIMMDRRKVKAKKEAAADDDERDSL